MIFPILFSFCQLATFFLIGGRWKEGIFFIAVNCDSVRRGRLLNMVVFIIVSIFFFFSSHWDICPLLFFSFRAPKPLFDILMGDSNKNIWSFID